MSGLDESTARPESGEACTCPYTDPKYWLSAASCGYGSGYEPGSMQEWDPDCPVHRPAPVAEPADGDELSRNSSALSQGDSVEALAQELRERIMDYGNHLSSIQGIDAARAILASDWLARRDEKRDREARRVAVLLAVDELERVAGIKVGDDESVWHKGFVLDWLRGFANSAALGDSTESGS